MSKPSRSVAALDNLDRLLAAGEISTNQHAVQRAQLLAVASATPHTQRMGMISTVVILLLIAVGALIVLRIAGAYINSLSGS